MLSFSASVAGGSSEEVVADVVVSTVATRANNARADGEKAVEADLFVIRVTVIWGERGTEARPKLCVCCRASVVVTKNLGCRRVTVVEPKEVAIKFPPHAKKNHVGFSLKMAQSQARKKRSPQKQDTNPEESR